MTPIIALGMAVLMAACASSSGRDPNNPFQRAEYRFVAQTTAAQGTNLGTIELDEVALRAQLPSNVVRASRIVNYTLEGNEGIENFYRIDKMVNNFGRLIFDDAQNRGTNFQLGFVLREFGASAFTVVAEISHTTADGGEHVLVRRVPVRVAAVENMANLNDLLDFSGRGSDFRDRVNVSVDRVYNGDITTRIASLDTLIPDLFGTGANSDDALIDLEIEPLPAPFTPSPDEAQYFSSNETMRGRAPGEIYAEDLFKFPANPADPVNTTQNLEITVELTTSANATFTYVIPANTPLSVINGNYTIDGSFISALSAAQQNDIINTANEELINTENTHFGAHVTSVRVSFALNYERNVYEERDAATTTRVLNYRAVGEVGENTAGGITVSRLGNVLTELGIAENTDLPEGYDFLPTIYYRLDQAGSLDANTACRQRYYVDYQAGNAVKVQPDDRISAGHKLNYETNNANPDTCVLVASLTGQSFADVRVTPSSEDLEGVERIAGDHASNSLADCTDNVEFAKNNDCSYVASVNIDLTNVNEPAVIGASTVFRLTLYEGDFGPAMKNATTLRGGLNLMTGTPATATDFSPRLILMANLTFSDEDQNAMGDNLPARLPEIVGVRPQLPAGVNPNQLFSINRINATDATLNLRNNFRHHIDYESLTPDASGFVGYTLTLRTTDNSTAALYSDTPYKVPVSDVIFKPELITGPAGIRGYTPLAGSVSQTTVPAFSAVGNILASPERDLIAQKILPGFQQFAFNGGPVLGQLNVQDPETNSSAGIEFQYNMTIQLEATSQWAAFRTVFLAGGGTQGERLAVLQSHASTVEGRFMRNFRLTGNNNETLSLAGLSLVPLEDTEYGATGFVNENITAPARDFNVPIVALNPLAPRDPVDIRVPISVQYNSTLVAGAGQPPVRFTSGQFAGFISENVTGPAAVMTLPTGTPGSEALVAEILVNDPVIPASYHLVTQEEVASFIGSLPQETADTLRGMFVGDQALFDLSETERFSVNRNTGAVSLATSNERLDFTKRHTYPLLMRVLPQSDLTLPLAQQFLRSDYTLVQVILEDVNEAPQIQNFRAAVGGVEVSESELTLSLGELEDDSKKFQVNATLAVLTIVDDNPTGQGFPRINFDTHFFGVRQTSEESVLNRAGTHYQRNYEITLAKVPDFDSFGNTVSQRLTFSDAGAYRVNETDPLAPPLRSSPVTNQLQVHLDASATLRQVNDPIRLRMAKRFGNDFVWDIQPAGFEATIEVPEKEAAGTNLRDYIIFLEDPENKISTANVPSHTITTDPSSLEEAFTLSFTLDDGIEGRPGPNFPESFRSRSTFSLQVANTTILENAGDGQTFDVTVSVTENTTDFNFTDPTHADAPFNPALTSEISFKVKIINDANDGDLSSLSLNPLAFDLTEQEAFDLTVDGSFEPQTLRTVLNLADLHTDYDEEFPGTNTPVANLEAKLTIALLPAHAAALKNVERFGLFDISTDNSAGSIGAVNLRLNEGRFIDRSFLGERVEATLSVTPTPESVGAGITGTATMPITVNIPEATPAEEVVFADATNNPNRVPHTPPVYNFEYRQSSYAAPISTSPCTTAENMTIDGQCYGTVTVDEGEIVARRDRPTGEGGYYREEVPEVLAYTRAPDEFGLVFVPDVITVDQLEVYQLDSNGFLTPSASFDDYFDVEYTQTYVDSGGRTSSTPSALLISLKAHDSPAIPTVLDTRPLSEAEETLSYFLVAIGDLDTGEVQPSVNATHRAIAQLNFEVSAARLGEAPVTSLHSNGCLTFLVDLIPLCTETQLTTNFDLDADYGLAADIPLTTVPWIPIGTADAPFTGSLDGYEFTLSGLKTTDPDGNADVNHAGLFGVIEDAEIRNLNIHAEDVKTNTVENSYAGILAGKALNSTIENVRVNMTAPSQGGGIEAIAIQYRQADGTEIGDIDFPSNTFAGGLVGHSSGSTTIHNSSAILDVLIAARSTYAYNERLNTIAAAGGLVGFNDGDISDSFVRGLDNGAVLAGGGIPVAGSNMDISAGGLVGYHRGAIDRSYAVIKDNITATVYGGNALRELALDLGSLNPPQTLDSTAETLSAGGLVGRIQNKDNLITDSYAIAEEVYALKFTSPDVLIQDTGRASQAGGLVGFVEGSEELEDGESHLDLSNVYAIVARIHSNATDALAGRLIGRRSGTAAALTSLPVVSSYYHNSIRNDFEDEPGMKIPIASFNNTRGDLREIDRLQCATSDDTTCGTGDTDRTFVDWDMSIWDFGDANTVPVLRSSAPCRLGPMVDCGF